MIVIKFSYIIVKSNFALNASQKTDTLKTRKDKKRNALNVGKSKILASFTPRKIQRMEGSLAAKPASAGRIKRKHIVKPVKKVVVVRNSPPAVNERCIVQTAVPKDRYRSPSTKELKNAIGAEP